MSAMFLSPSCNPFDTGVDPETGTIQSTPTPNVWLTPSGAAISLSKTGMPLLQSGMPTMEEGTQFPEPTPRTITPDPEVLEAMRVNGWMDCITGRADWSSVMELSTMETSRRA